MRSTQTRSTFVAVTAFVLTFTVSSAAHATISSICPSPNQMATEWQNAVPLDNCQVGEGPKFCKAWISTCKKLVRVTHKCLLTQVAADTKVAKARCKLDDVIDKKQCRKDATDHAKTVKSRLKPDRDFALDACEDHLADCITRCED